jgi:hypothetical protein
VKKPSGAPGLPEIDGCQLNLNCQELRNKSMVHARTDYNRIQDPAGKIGEDEPVMLFRAQDALMPAVAAFYADLLRQHRSAQHMIDTTLAHEQRIRQWQRMNGCKLPDMPEDAVPERTTRPDPQPASIQKQEVNASYREID